ncbi:MAG: HAMP domain-containing protein [Giesbergeria sp.]|nr:HAMP domain-containing protein [Giesbergeria sp.]
MAALDHLPRLSESLGQARAVGVTLLNGGQADPGGQARVAGLVEAAYSAERHAQAALVLAMADSVDAKTALAAPAEQAHKAAQAGLALVESKIVQAAALDMPSKEYFGALTAQIDAQIALLDKAMQVMSAEVAGRVASVRNQLLLICALSGILAAIAAAMLVLVTRGTTRAAGLALGLARSIAEGDLSREMPPAGKDEMGQMLAALATMNASLHGIVGAVRSSSETIATGASQVAAGSLDLSQRTEEQASNLEQTAASMEQLSSTVQSNADVARQAAQLAGSASEVAARGGAVVSEVVSTMAEINTASRRIGDIIGVIDGIAFQTNILALNAAVEAARAGEQGRGFAVVASEVRSLAGRSANAAKEIKALIMDSVQKVDAGGQLVQQAGVTIGEIVAQVQQVTQLISGISQATAEQTLGIAQMSAAVDQLDQVTQQNAALVEESSAAADSLSEHAGQLLAAVRVFKLGTGEDRAPVAARVRALR